MRSFKPASWLLLAFAVAAAPGAPAAAQECRADLDAVLASEERRGSGTVLTYEIEVRSDAICAEVDFFFRATQRSGATSREIQRLRHTRVRDRRPTVALLTYSVPAGARLFDRRFEVDRCTPCEPLR